MHVKYIKLRPGLIIRPKYFERKSAIIGDKRSSDFTAIRRPDWQQKLRDQVKVISREAKREMLGEKVAGMWEGNREHLPRSDRRNLFKRFESADLTRLWRIYARSVDEKVKDWQGEHRANEGEKKSKNGER